MRTYACRAVSLDILEKSYDNVIIPTDRKCHFKAAIGERNKWLAENCDMMIVYIVILHKNRKNFSKTIDKPFLP